MLNVLQPGADDSRNGFQTSPRLRINVDRRMGRSQGGGDVSGAGGSFQPQQADVVFVSQRNDKPTSAFSDTRVCI